MFAFEKKKGAAVGPLRLGHRAIDGRGTAERVGATSRAAVPAVTGFMSEVGGEEFMSEVGDMMVPERNGKSAYVEKEAAAGRPPRRRYAINERGMPENSAPPKRAA